MWWTVDGGGGVGGSGAAAENSLSESVSSTQRCVQSDRPITFFISVTVTPHEEEELDDDGRRRWSEGMWCVRVQQSQVFTLVLSSIMSRFYCTVCTRSTYEYCLTTTHKAAVQRVHTGQEVSFTVHTLTEYAWWGHYTTAIQRKHANSANSANSTYSHYRILFRVHVKAATHTHIIIL